MFRAAINIQYVAIDWLSLDWIDGSCKEFDLTTLTKRIIGPGRFFKKKKKSLSNFKIDFIQFFLLLLHPL